MLKRYVQENNLQFIEEYVDDGVSRNYFW
jgi:hypothetical protein